MIKSGESVDMGVLCDSIPRKKQEGYNKCPICHSDGEVISSRSMLDTMKEQRERFKKRKKRIIL